MSRKKEKWQDPRQLDLFDDLIVDYGRFLSLGDFRFRILNDLEIAIYYSRTISMPRVEHIND